MLFETEFLGLSFFYSSLTYTSANKCILLQKTYTFVFVPFIQEMLGTPFTSALNCYLNFLLLINLPNIYTFSL